MLFGGFNKCLFPVQKLDSGTERRFVVVMWCDRFVQKWVTPPEGVFPVDYAGNSAYEPDFVAETASDYDLCEARAED